MFITIDIKFVEYGDDFDFETYDSLDDALTAFAEDCDGAIMDGLTDLAEDFGIDLGSTHKIVVKSSSAPAARQLAIHT